MFTDINISRPFGQLTLVSLSLSLFVLIGSPQLKADTTNSDSGTAVSYSDFSAGNLSGTANALYIDASVEQADLLRKQINQNALDENTLHVTQHKKQDQTDRYSENY